MESSSPRKKVKVKLLSCVRLLATPWTAAYQAPPTMGFSRQEHWSGVPFSSPVRDQTCTPAESEPLDHQGSPTPSYFEEDSAAGLTDEDVTAWCRNQGGGRNMGLKIRKFWVLIVLLPFADWEALSRSLNPRFSLHICKMRAISPTTRGYYEHRARECIKLQFTHQLLETGPWITLFIRNGLSGHYKHTFPYPQLTKPFEEYIMLPMLIFY